MFFSPLDKVLVWELVLNSLSPPPLFLGGGKNSTPNAACRDYSAAPTFLLCFVVKLPMKSLSEMPNHICLFSVFAQNHEV